MHPRCRLRRGLGRCRSGGLVQGHLIGPVATRVVGCVCDHGRVALHHPRAPSNRSIQRGFRGFELSVRSTLQPSITLLVRYRFWVSVPPWDGSKSLVQTAVSSRSTQGSRSAHQLSVPQTVGMPRDCHPKLWSVPGTLRPSMEALRHWSPVPSLRTACGWSMKADHPARRR
jgi:hypothetical protein